MEWHYVRGHVGIPGNERVDEIANAYALQDDPGLYEGPLSDYPVRILDIPEDTSLPTSSSSSGQKGGRHTPISASLTESRCAMPPGPGASKG